MSSMTWEACGGNGVTIVLTANAHFRSADSYSWKVGYEAGSGSRGKVDDFQSGFEDGDVAGEFNWEPIGVGGSSGQEDCN